MVTSITKFVGYTLDPDKETFAFAKLSQSAVLLRTHFP
jgi:hypothetical protein